MILYFAGSSLQYMLDLFALTEHALETYLCVRANRESFEAALGDIEKKGLDLFLDSGAFGAWARGETINIDEYAEFCLATQDRLGPIASLDVIPGSWGRLPTPQEVETSAAGGWNNYQYLLSKGLRKGQLVHTFHQGEEFKWLERLLQESPFIALSPANDRTTEQKIFWLDRCMDYVTDSAGRAVVKFHGFGVTSFEVMKRYPWWSVDSTTWLRPGAFGYIWVPNRFKGKLSFSDRPWLVGVSPKSSSRKIRGKHYRNCTDAERELTRDYLGSLGVELDQVTQDYKVRHKVNIAFFKLFEQEINSAECLFRRSQPTFV